MIDWRVVLVCVVACLAFAAVSAAVTYARYLPDIRAGRRARSPQPAPPPAPPPPPEAPEPALGSLARWLPLGDRLARGILDGGLPPSPEALASAVTVAAAHGWASGVTELRAALLAQAGPLAPILDASCAVALSSMDRPSEG